MNSLVRTNGNLLPSLLNDFFADDWLDSSLDQWRSHGGTLPAVNLRETSEDFQIDVAAPGMKREDFKVELDNNILAISSERLQQQEEKDKHGSYTRREFSYQSFQRNFSLPESKVDRDKIEARYADGILHIVVPKKDEAKVKPVKVIKVS
ncbi:MAG TPA: Hsp20/alpha crystallin family protein [Chryseolinea sp.]